MKKVLCILSLSLLGIISVYSQTKGSSLTTQIQECLRQGAYSHSISTDDPSFCHTDVIVNNNIKLSLSAYFNYIPDFHQIRIVIIGGFIPMSTLRNNYIMPDADYESDINEYSSMLNVTFAFQDGSSIKADCMVRCSDSSYDPVVFDIYDENIFLNSKKLINKLTASNLTKISIGTVAFEFVDLHSAPTLKLMRLKQSHEDGQPSASKSNLKTTNYPGVVIENGVLKQVPYDFKGEFVVGDEVTVIGSGVFGSCEGLTNVVISNSVTRIENSAFARTGLTNIIIPNSVSSIGQGAFNGCKKLESATISNSIRSIERNTFAGCDNLIRVSMSNGVEYIGEGAFQWCFRLESITIPNSVRGIEERAFSNCKKLTSVSMSDGLQYIGKSAFSNCVKLESVTIPNSVTSIGNNAFYSCESLYSISVPGNVTSIGDEAFYKCQKLSNLTLSDGLIKIGARTFKFCDNLEIVIIPYSVMNIGVGAFSYTDKLSTVVIKNSMTNVEENAFQMSNLDNDELIRIYVPRGSRARFEEMIPHGDIREK